MHPYMKWVPERDF